MIKVEEVAKTMSLEDFKKRFTQEHQGVKDNLTGKIHFCIHDFGFEASQEECLKIRNCKECMNGAMDYLKFRANQKKVGDKMGNMPDSMYDYRPQNQAAKQIAVCSCCGWGIYIGDDYWLIENKNYCKECIDHLKKVGEEE